ncbi:hypothetical protein LTR99_006747 [Exophiala xenobiotica]|uniref:Aminotransferase class V domain-containing protein n=1 Tax=Vermiconidia calcicola TaxID=1690605 RepID=A0AAV9PZE2_9PEZI|nr:hypothetical protein LTR92_006566 [Exophiala xenobiotica]KAK5531743.1 hypothetical protein LTR25_008073 [Vermiconidia calcicola]KAK5542788.1 hypothetical protein LTR23_005398 [Chaetothyriales sp. CCFEE 6169]KAK5221427.1 hypothetical protein LTR72_006987 [Exophiala xenobiotica]KAK5232628.1 hypothetical protein LTR47_006192 [Exophiala xenobiotica]
MGVVGGMNDGTVCSDSPVSFGKQMRERYFLFEKNYINLNHGSFGAHPLPVRQELSRLQNEADANPDKFIRFTSPTYLDTCRRRVSEMLHSHCDEVVITLNATTAINTVLRNLYFQQGDHILMLSCVYGAVKKTAEYLAETTPVQLDEVDCTFPVADDEVISRFRAAVRRHSSRGTSIKVAIFDTIASMPGVRLPFERLIEECRAHGILSVVDGAHGIGCIPINLSQLRPDFFVSNCHKWLFVPRSSAVLYVPFRHQHLIRSSIPTSHSFVPRSTGFAGQRHIVNPMLLESGKSYFVSLFQYTGTVDSTPGLCIDVALRFRAQICGGEHAIQRYCCDLARRGEVLAAGILGTEGLAIAEKNRVGFANVRLPIDNALLSSPAYCTGDTEDHDTVANRINDFLHRAMMDEYNTYIPVIFQGGAFWARFSAQIYLDLDAFAYGAAALKELCIRVNSCGAVAVLGHTGEMAGSQQRRTTSVL